MSEYWKAYLSNGTHATYEFVRPVSAYTATHAIEEMEKNPENSEQIKVIHIKEG